MPKVNIFFRRNDNYHTLHKYTKICANWMRASCWFLCLKKSAITFGEGCIYRSHVNVTQTVPDISSLISMHQDPLLVILRIVSKISQTARWVGPKSAQLRHCYPSVGPTLPQLTLLSGITWQGTSLLCKLKPVSNKKNSRLSTSRPPLFRQWLVAWKAPGRYINQCWDIVNWTLRNKLQWKLNRNFYISIQDVIGTLLLRPVSAGMVLINWEADFTYQLQMGK